MIEIPWPAGALHPNATCKIEGCDKPIYNAKREWCQMHYRRWQRNGDPERTKRTPNGAPMRFLMDVALSHAGDECLNWPFKKDGYGYPNIRNAGLGRKPHRILCELAHGPQPTPERREVAHSCGNRGCVNPLHLRWATPAENQADRVIHGTSNRGERQWMSKLTEEDVLKIRALEGKLSRSQIAQMFGVRPPCIDKIHWRQRWAWL